MHSFLPLALLSGAAWRYVRGPLLAGRLVPAISRGWLPLVGGTRGAAAARREAGGVMAGKIDARSIRSMRKEIERIRGRDLPKDLNQKFGLPFHEQRGTSRVYENGPSAASSADRSQYPIAGMATPNISSSSIMSPEYGPGGV